MYTDSDGVFSSGKVLNRINRILVYLYVSLLTELDQKKKKLGDSLNQGFLELHDNARFIEWKEMQAIHTRVLAWMTVLASTLTRA